MRSDESRVSKSRASSPDGLIGKGWLIGASRPAQRWSTTGDAEACSADNITRQHSFQLVFFRNAGLPAELCRLAALHFECEKRGATLAVISAQLPPPHPADKDPATHIFLLLADKGAKVARSYGLAYRAPPVGRSPGTAEDPYDSLKRRRGRNESAPATYIVDQKSVIALAFVDLEGRSRMESDQIVMALECLGKRR